MEKIPQLIQIQLSTKPKTFNELSITFLESKSNFQHFEIKDEPHSSTVSDSIDSETSCYLNVLKGYVLGHP